MHKKIHPINELPSTIILGRQTETGVNEVRLDCAEWLALWPKLKINVMVTPPGGDSAYSAKTHMESDVLVWPVTDSDTAVAGSGTMEVLGTADGQRKLSAIATTRILATTTITQGEAPESARPWVEEVLAAAEQINKNVDVGTSGLYIVRATPDPDFRNFPKADRTQEEIRAAVAAGKTVLLVYSELESDYTDAHEARVMTYAGEIVKDASGNTCPTFDGYIANNTKGIPYYYQAYVQADGYVSRSGSVLRAATKFPLKFTGAVEATYDGRETVTVNIPQGGSGGVPDPGTAHQQRVSDENGKAVWVDRTHYAETNAVELLPATALTDTGEGAFILSTSPTHDLVIGTIATVTYNGTAYACEVAPYAEEDVIVGAMVGNFAIAGGEGGNADAPFIALILSTSNAAEQGYGGVVVPTDGATSITISITGTVFEYHKLDNAYLDLDYVPKSNPKTETSPVPLRLYPGGEDNELNSDAAQKMLKACKIRVLNGGTSEEWICKPVKWECGMQYVKVFFGDANLTGEYPFAIWAQINYTGASVGVTGAGVLTDDKYTEAQNFFLYIYQEENCVPLTMLPEFPVLRLGTMGYKDSNHSVILSAHEDGILYMYSPGTGTVQTVGAVLTSPSGRKYKLSVSDDGALSTTLMS